MDDQNQAMEQQDLEGASQLVVAGQHLKSDGEPPFHVVGIGTSAGGLEALERLFGGMPLATNMAFVVLQHLSPDFESHMDKLLGRCTQIPILRCEDGMAVKANHIYLIPPKKEMIISGGRLLLTDKDPLQGLSLPIDHFFRSLAHDMAERSIGIILSGTGSDGSRGIQDIRRAGGLVICQSEETAKFDGMPLSAQETGAVDLVLPPEAIPDALLKYARQPAGTQVEVQPVALPGKDGAIDQIIKLLRQEYAIDFSYYKPNTVARRIERRLGLNQISDVECYSERLEEDADELNRLYKDLLIGVTHFFRDPDAFSELENIILGDIISRRTPGEQFRIWVAGCATGEEAYSLAMVVREQLEKTNKRSPDDLKIFATDVHRASLEVASTGIYREEALKHLSQERRRRYFRRREGHYQVSSDLRSLIVFAPHNVLKDAPFTKLDLISCRNLLIYLQPIAQKKALSLFHFGLKTGGLLMLGPSETPGDLSDEFETLHNQWKIYRKRRDVRLTGDFQMPISTGQPTAARHCESPPEMNRQSDQRLLATYDRLLAKYMPPGLLVDEKYELLHIFGGAERFLHLRPGRPSNRLLDLLLDELKPPVSGAVQRALKELTVVGYSGLQLRSNGKQEQFRLQVDPLYDKATHSTHVLVTFERMGEVETPPKSSDDVAIDTASHEHLDLLESELRLTKENLQATIEELETSNEELQATNEELVASNEELQSTNEELHSVNEELYTVNSEYQRKIAELTEMTDDMSNLLESTDVGVMFLDRGLCIRKFTPQIERLFNLLPQDVGRRIQGFAHNIQDLDLLRDIERVSQTKTVAEREVRDRDGHHFFLRILPYRSKTENSGIVLTLVNIDSLKQAEARLQRLSAIVESSHDAIIGHDREGTVSTWNRSAEQLYGYTAEEAIGQNISTLIVPPDRCDEVPGVMRRIEQGESVDHVETVRLRKDGKLVFVSQRISPIYDNGTLLGASAIDRDVTERKRASQRLAVEHAVSQILVESTSFEDAAPRILDALYENLDADVAEMWQMDDETGQLICTSVRTAEKGPLWKRWKETAQRTRYRVDQALPGLVVRHEQPEWLDDPDSERDEVRRRQFRELQFRTACGFPIMVGGQCLAVVALYARQVIGSSEPLIRMMRTLGRNIGEFVRRIRAEENLKLHNRATASAKNGILITDAQKPDHPIIYANRGFERITGYSEQEVLGRNCRFLQGANTDRQVVATIRQAIIDEQQCQVTLLNYRKDGTPFWNELHISPVRNEQDRVTHFIGVQNDVTERVVTEQTLRESQERLRLIVESASDYAIFTLDTEGRINSWNTGSENIFGYQENEIVGRDGAVLFTPEDRQRKQPQIELESALRKGRAADNRWHVRKDGSQFWANGHIIALRGESNEPIGFLKIIQDRTEAKQAMDELQNARQEAEAASQAKSEFLANMSHEIRSPMTAILGYADVLEAHLQDPDNLSCVHTIKRNGRHLLELINDILDLSKIEANKFEVERRRYSPTELVAEVRSLMEVRAQEKQIPLTIEYDGLMPEHIESDPTRLRQILVNLLGNAIKFTEKGGVRLVVRFLPADKNHRARMQFDVIDTGIGMTQQQQDRLFHPFTQADASMTRRFGGTGLGLTISQRLAKMLGGEITVDSQPNRGSRFTVTVDVGPMDHVKLIEPRHGITLPQRSPPAPSQQLHNCRVLVVDDRRDIRYLAQHFIEEAGGKVTVAGNGQKAIEKVRRAENQGQPFDVVVMDMQMPVLDGYQTTRKLRTMGFDKPILALTAEAMRGDREKCLAIGCNDYSSKPIDGRHLVELIAKYCQDGSTAPSKAPASTCASACKPEENKGHKMRVLLVDDSRDACQAMQMLLQMSGHQVLVAHSGSEALQAAESFLPNVVILDIGLPDLDGFEVAKRLRQADATNRATLIALSGRGDEHDRTTAEQAGFHHYVMKPASPQDLEQCFPK